MSAEIKPMEPVTPAKIGMLLDALDMPDVTAMQEVDALDDASLVEFAFFVEQAVERANIIVRATLQPAVDAAARARDLIRGTIIDNGGKALAHDTFDVRLIQATRKDKRIDVLRQLETLLPADLYREAVFIESVDVSHADPKAVDAVVAAGGKPAWGANLTKLNKHARDFGGDIARIVKDGSPEVDVGAPKLVIEPRPSAMKAVN